jgi:membrane-bound ClpP family serine protease
MLFWAIMVLFTLLTSALLTLVVVSRRKKIAMHGVPAVGAIAIVSSTLAPEGTVLLAGELWRAQTAGKVAIDQYATVSIVAIRDHLLVVELL